MKAYIINLKDSTVRKERVKRILSNYSFLDINFINAFDARKMSLDSLSRKFDRETFKKIYTHDVRPGEIGCTLSHQECYRQILNNNDDYAIIFEDDIEISNTKFKQIVDFATKNFLNTKKPTIILLSGGFWYTSKIFKNEEVSFVNVFDAFMTHSYIINKPAAELMINERPYFLADEWYLFRKKYKINIIGIKPHIFNQDWSESGTVINIDNNQKDKKSVTWYIINIKQIVLRKLFKLLNLYEKEI